MKNILILFFLLAVTLPASAQYSMGSHLMRGTWQSNQSNVAIIPNEGITIALPGFYNYLVSENVTYEDLTGTVVDGRRNVDIDGVINKLEETNLIRENLFIETIGVGLKFGRFYGSFSHALKYSNFFDYPKAFPQLVWQGNAQFVGQDVAFGPEAHFFSYHELAFGAAYQITDQIAIGGRFKMLNGIDDISTERSGLNLFTDDDIYQLTLNADYLVNSSGSLDYNGLDDISVSFEFGQFSMKDLFTPNKGYAVDLGVYLNFGKLDVAASVLDLGEITWKRDVNNYTLNGTFEYKGLDPAEGLLADSTNIGSVVDSLRDIYEPTESSNSYRTKLPGHYLVSATYQLSENLRLGGIFYTENYRDRMNPAFGVSANYQITPFLNLGGVYAYKNETWDNIGLNAVVGFGPVQIIAATDNILSVFNFKNANNADLRVGINVVLNRRGDVDMNNIEDQEEFFRR